MANTPATNTPSAKSPRPRRDEAHLDRRVEPEYASISGAAIFALVLAAIGCLALLPNQPPIPLPMTRYRFPMLAVLPLAAIVTALLALRSIRRSEGTTVGRQPARIALVGAIGIVVASLGLQFGIQHHHFRLQDELEAGAFERLQLIFHKNYKPVLDEMVRNTNQPVPPNAIEQWVRQTDGALYTGGDYYGYQLEKVVIQNGEVQSPDETPPLMGMAVYRLFFAQGTVDLSFSFVRRGDQWDLFRADSRPNVMGTIPEGAKPLPRFEPLPKTN